LLAIGLSGGIIIGCDGSQFILENTIVSAFSVTLMLKNRVDDAKWTFTYVYDPVNASLKGQFWEELRNINTVRYTTWLLCENFNAIRFKHEKSDHNFQSRASARFNAFLDDYNLIEYELSNRKFTWSNERHFALLDRFLCSIQWDSLYNNNIVRDLAKYGSDHCPLMLQTNMANLNASYIFRCDKVWFDIPEFNELVLKWWLEF
jgi:hypothetical protein